MFGGDAIDDHRGGAAKIFDLDAVLGFEAVIDRCGDVVFQRAENDDFAFLLGGLNEFGGLGKVAAMSR